jgi:xanthine dehydrogenase small subunit
MKTRHHLVLYVNERRVEVAPEQCFMTLSDFLRYERSLTGTKVVCAEGDCGACTVLVASVHALEEEKFIFKSVNSCILPMLALDGCRVVTVEGLPKDGKLHPVQEAMDQNFGSQCGFCTPGFVCAMTALVEDSILNKKNITGKRAQNYLTGNLCRCTGYTPILKAATSVDLKKTEPLQKRFSEAAVVADLKAEVQIPVEISSAQLKLFIPTTLKEALRVKSAFPDLRLVAGATDIGVWINKGKARYQNVMSLQNIPELWQVQKQKDKLIIPARVTLASLQNHLTPGQAEFDGILNIFASMQIKNTGTVVGNVVNASPIADTIPFLLVNDAEIEVQSIEGTRFIPMDEFYLGYKKLNLKPTEIVTAIHLPLSSEKQLSKLYKVSLRKDLDISAVTMAARFKLKGPHIEEARLAFGGVGPVVIRLKEIETKWVGQKLEKGLLEALSENISQFVTPISDVRGTKEYRLLLCKNLLQKMADECL